MATLLYRLGKFCFRKRGFILVFWAIALLSAVICAFLFMGKLSTSFTIPGTEAQATLDRLKDDLPEFSGSSGIVVFNNNGEPFTGEQKKNIGEAINSLSPRPGNPDAIDGVKAATDPFEQEESIRKNSEETTRNKETVGQYKARMAILEQQAAANGVPLPPEMRQEIEQLHQKEKLLHFSEQALRAAQDYPLLSKDGTIALAQIQLEKPTAEVSEETRSEIRNRINEAKENGKFGETTVEYSQDLVFEVPGLVGPGEVVGLLFAAAVLILTLGSLVAAGLPIIQAILGVGIGAAITLAFSSAVEMSSISTTLAVMLGLAVGIDYALFIINRYRRELLLGRQPEEAAGRSIGTAGSAVIIAGLTVIIALSALSVPGFTVLTVMGLAAAFTVTVSVLIAITVTPALLGYTDSRILPRKLRERIVKNEPIQIAQDQKPGRYANFIGKASLPILLIGTLVLGVIALPAFNLHLGLPDGSAESTDSTAYKADRLIANNFGPGRNAAILVAVTLPEDPDRTNAALFESSLDVADDLSRLKNIDVIIPVTMPDPATAEKASSTNTALLQIVPHEGPSSSNTTQLVLDLRDRHDQVKDKTGADISVTGRSALNIDVSQKLADAMPVYVLIVVGLSLILLLMLFRSILLPLLATFGFLLSLATSFGATVAVYQWGWLGPIFDVHDPTAIFCFLPIILVGVLFGLAMDYQVFLGSSIRESYIHGAKNDQGAREAVLEGLQHSKRVIVAAALIMTAVFAGFIFNDSPMIRPIGFALAFGVAIDAFVVRLVLIPAAMRLIGSDIWWLPRWLDRIMPNIDVEGENLKSDDTSTSALPVEKAENL